MGRAHKRVLQNGRKRISQAHNRDIDLTARRLLLISVVRPTLEYGNEVWEDNKAQAKDGVCSLLFHLFFIICHPSFI